MYDYIRGVLTELSPTEAILEANSIGYKILISLQTYSKLKQEQTVKLYIHHHLREDAEMFFGFFDKEERYLFVQLTGVSGIGPNTARMMLSSLSCEEIRNAIITSDVNRLKSIKGIGLKTAQRLLIELKDKIGRGEPYDLTTSVLPAEGSRIREEATTALVLLGFSRSNVDKVTGDIIREMPQAKLEEVIKVALKRL